MERREETGLTEEWSTLPTGSTSPAWTPDRSPGPAPRAWRVLPFLWPLLTMALVASATPTRPAISCGQNLPAGPGLFEVELASCSYGGAAIADLDGDGDQEIVFGTYFNDERVIALHHDGSLLWALPSGGGPVDGSVTLADLDADGRPEVLWGNARTTVFHVADASGRDIWSRRIGEVLDAPHGVADLDGDGWLEIVLASCGSDRVPGAPGLRAFRGMSGSLVWQAERGGCYQSAPLLFDQDGDGLVDVVVSTWFDDKVRAFSGLDGRLRWQTTIGDQTYHAGSFGDLSGDGVPDVALGDYSGTLWALNGRDGAVLWSRRLEGVNYVFGPTAMADLDGDGRLEVVVAADRLFVYGADGRRLLQVRLPGYCSRGPLLTDLDGDGRADILVALAGPRLQVYRGNDGSLLWEQRLPGSAAMDFHPALADLDGDGRIEVFTVYGRGQSDTPEQNWGRAVALALGARAGEWPTYSHDHHHSGNFGYPVGAAVNTPRAPQPTLSPTAGPGTPGSTQTGGATASATVAPANTPTGGATASATVAPANTPTGSATESPTELATSRPTPAVATSSATPVALSSPTLGRPTSTRVLSTATRATDPAHAGRVLLPYAVVR